MYFVAANYFGIEEPSLVSTRNVEPGFDADSVASGISLTGEMQIPRRERCANPTQIRQTGKAKNIMYQCFIIEDIKPDSN